MCVRHEQIASIQLWMHALASVVYQCSMCDTMVVFVWITYQIIVLGCVWCPRKRQCDNVDGLYTRSDDGFTACVCAVLGVSLRAVCSSHRLEQITSVHSLFDAGTCICWMFTR
jgi:hypothetical protein